MCCGGISRCYCSLKSQWKILALLLCSGAIACLPLSDNRTNRRLLFGCHMVATMVHLAVWGVMLYITVNVEHRRRFRRGGLCLSLLGVRQYSTPPRSTCISKDCAITTIVVLPGRTTGICDPPIYNLNTLEKSREVQQPSSVASVCSTEQNHVLGFLGVHRLKGGRRHQRGRARSAPDPLVNPLSQSVKLSARPQPNTACTSQSLCLVNPERTGCVPFTSKCLLPPDNPQLLAAMVPLAVSSAPRSKRTSLVVVQNDRWLHNLGSKLPVFTKEDTKTISPEVGLRGGHAEPPDPEGETRTANITNTRRSENMFLSPRNKPRVSLPPKFVDAHLLHMTSPNVIKHVAIVLVVAVLVALLQVPFLVYAWKNITVFSSANKEGTGDLIDTNSLFLVRFTLCASEVFALLEVIRNTWHSAVVRLRHCFLCKWIRSRKIGTTTVFFKRSSFGSLQPRSSAPVTPRKKLAVGFVRVLVIAVLTFVVNFSTAPTPARRGWSGVAIQYSCLGLWLVFASTTSVALTGVWLGMRDAVKRLSSKPAQVVPRREDHNSTTLHKTGVTVTGREKEQHRKLQHFSVCALCIFARVVVGVPWIVGSMKPSVGVLGVVPMLVLDAIIFMHAHLFAQSCPA
jgi:hypothetical protein